jgi:hypothetical protein
MFGKGNQLPGEFCVFLDGFQSMVLALVRTREFFRLCDQTGGLG